MNEQFDNTLTADQEKELNRLQHYFWWPFIVIPLVFGFFAYRFLPNESFDPEKHILLDSEWVEKNDRQMGEMYLEWEDKKTGRVYSRAGFQNHRNAEAYRIASWFFAYGLIGCAFFGWTQAKRRPREFYAAFGKAVLVDLGLALFMWVHV